MLKTNKLFTLVFCSISTIYWLAPCSAYAATFYLPQNSRDSVIGELRFITANKNDTLLDLARANGLGHDQIVKANPKVNRWLPDAKTKVLISSFYVLPDAEQKGIVLNLPELRLYYFPPGKISDQQIVETYPVSVGRMDWTTPIGVTRVTRKDRNPAWYPPASIRAEHAAEGDYLPPFIPGGDPDNPLGHHAIRLGIPGYLIHGVDARKSFGIGMQVTHGCVRMYPEDIEVLFERVKVGDPVNIVDQPIKVGWLEGTLYIEVHLPFEEEGAIHTGVSFQTALHLVLAKSGGYAEIDEKAIAMAVEAGNGVPTIVGQTKSGLPPARSHR